MLKSCPSCSYIGNDGEHVCPFCKADLAAGKPRRSSGNRASGLNMKTLTFLALVIGLLSVTTTGCSVDPAGPAMSGAEHGLLGSTNMSDYYYKRDAGWTYVYQNVEKIYDTNGSVVHTLTGAPDTVRTMGFDGFAPNGDSLFRIEITYRILSTYAGLPYLDVYYIPSTKKNSTNGAFVDGGVTGLTGETVLLKKPRPVSTDTILAGLVGRVRTTVDDFTNNSANSYTWQKDTLWVTSRLDTVFIWEYLPGTTTKVQSRCLFLRDFQNNDSWAYDIINAPNYGTYYFVDDKDCSMTTAAGTFSHCVNVAVQTTEIEDKDFNRENKWYACFYGPVYQYDWWYVTTDGNSFNKEDFSRSLVSVTHN
ncbi:MAG: hypothetical protein Q8922_02920 [Bacteroidota bacterium]|nr:hypothetical protein [Bacteroidota bacterium]MDP4232918.1 hypothetical protein [Bacteroidota bacterium]MDP4241962.1 hypothetical protein [Bacteroidota bacterium]MDP4286865.1 hypothetical protein [Bacteroidota bacterium]